jgi:hypothetical protein
VVLKKQKGCEKSCQCVDYHTRNIKEKLGFIHNAILAIHTKLSVAVVSELHCSLAVVL